MWIPLYVTSFSLAAFHIFYLYFIFDSLINMYLAGFFLHLSCMGSLHFLGLIDYFLSHVKEAFNYNLLKYFLRPFLFFFFFWKPIIQMLVHLMLSQRSLRLLDSFHSFLFILLYSTYFHYFIFQVTYPFFCLCYSALDSF